MREPHIYLGAYEGSEWSWAFIAGNGITQARSSDTYATKKGAIANAERVLGGYYQPEERDPDTGEVLEDQHFVRVILDPAMALMHDQTLWIREPS